MPSEHRGGEANDVRHAAGQVVVHETWHDREVLLSVRGVVDHLTAGTLARRLDVVLAWGAEQVLVDLADVAAMGVTGYQVLARSARRLDERGGRLLVVGGGPDMGRVADMLGLRSAGLLSAHRDQR